MSKTSLKNNALVSFIIYYMHLNVFCQFYRVFNIRIIMLYRIYRIFRHMKVIGKVVWILYKLNNQKNWKISSDTCCILQNFHQIFSPSWHIQFSSCMIYASDHIRNPLCRKAHLSRGSASGSFCRFSKDSGRLFGKWRDILKTSFSTVLPQPAGRVISGIRK